MPGCRRLVVVVAHPHEELCAAGGLMRELVNRGVPVSVLAVTDTGAERLAAAYRTSGLRGVRRYRLGLPGGCVEAAEHDVMAAVSELVGFADPEGLWCLAPWELDGHPDHDAVGRAAVTACSAYQLPLLRYPVARCGAWDGDHRSALTRGEGRMDHEQFLTMVAQIAHTDRDTAERASQIVLSVLGQHLTRGEAADVLRSLPEELQAYAWSPGSPERFPPEEFVRRVAEREGTDLLTAERHSRAVFTALRQAIGPDEFADVRAQLGKHYAALLDAATFVPSVEDVVGAVAAESGVDHDAARRLTEAVLETLAERIAPGDSDDLAARLPVALHPPLHRGRDADGLSRRMGPDEFARRVARRAGLSLDEAARRIPAVFAVLRSIVGEEFFDLSVQLPDQYRPLLGAGRHPRDRHPRGGSRAHQPDP